MVQGRPPFDGAWGSDMFHFFCHMFYRECAFEDMYCFCLRLLDRMFVSMDADYADFHIVVAALRSRLCEALAQRPLSFREFKRLVSATSSECEGSIYSSSGHGPGSDMGTGSASSSVDGGSEHAEGHEQQLARAIADGLAQLPKAIDGLLTSGLKGAAGTLSKFLPRDAANRAALASGSR